MLKQTVVKGVLKQVATQQSPDTPVLLENCAATSKAPRSIFDEMNAAIGCKTSEVALLFLAQLVRIDDPTDQKMATQAGVDELLARNTALLAEMEPKNATQACLAVQMIAVQKVAMSFLHRSMLPGQTYTPAIDANVQRATRLMRLWVEQAEMMSKLKGTAGQQKVTVEHVTVQSGGQAVVGAVGALPGGGYGG